MNHKSCLAGFVAGALTALNADPLPSWNNRLHKWTLLEFVAQATTPGQPAWVPPSERLAVFDTDGTLWTEQPLPLQTLFALDRIRALAAQHPPWATQEPFAAILRGNLRALLDGSDHTARQLLEQGRAGLDPHAFSLSVADWLAQSRHPVTDRVYARMVYQPMRELIDHLRAHRFQVLLRTRGDLAFTRILARETFACPADHVLPAEPDARLTAGQNPAGPPHQTDAPASNAAGNAPNPLPRPFPPPLLAFGNADDDLPWMEGAPDATKPRLRGLIHHTDADREWAYDRQATHGRLDRGLDRARARGWIVVSMRDDWQRIHPRPTSVRPSPAEEVRLIERWSGDYPVDALSLLPEGQQDTDVGFLRTAAELEPVWSRLQPGQPLPAVDFERDVVVFARNTELHRRIAIGRATCQRGILTLLLVEGLSSRPIESVVGLTLAILPRAGIQSLQGGRARIELDRKN